MTRNLTHDEFKAFLDKHNLHTDRPPYKGIYRKSDGQGVGKFYLRRDGVQIIMYKEWNK